MNAREEILRRIRESGASSTRGEVTRSYRREDGKEGNAGSRLDLLVDRLVDYGASVVQATESELHSCTADALDRRGARRIAVPKGYPVEWLPQEYEWLFEDESLTPEVLDGADAVVTTSVLAIAETGTIVLDGGLGMGRRALSLLPDLHVVIVRESSVVVGVPAAIALLDSTRPLTWISGPSATSDIELNRIEGVHGPRQLSVVLLKSSHPSWRGV